MTSIDNTAPNVNLSAARNPAFSASSIPFGLSDAGWSASPTFGDIDGDGDLDLFIGSSLGTLYYRNTGSASSAAFSASEIAFGLPELVSNANKYYASPELADIDTDGDLDLFVGDNYGNTLFFRNTGSSTSAGFADSSIGFGLPALGSKSYSNQAFADIDGDGDLDLFIGNADGILYYQNTGNRSNASFAASAIGFGLSDTGSYVKPTFVDIDADGDLDLFVGAYNGSILLFQNTGNSTSAAFAGSSINFGLPDIGRSSSPAFADIDSDGDLDLFVGEYDGSTLFFENTGSGGITSTNANGSYGIGSSITIEVPFTEVVTVDITDGTPTLLLNTGSTKRTATYVSGSGTTTLSFSYSVQAGDTSADLNYTSSSALSLNGGTIKDGAGNGAILTLAPPNSASSLAGTSNLVIDTKAPTGSLISTTPAYAAAVTNPYGLTNVNGNAVPVLADVDGDGDLDLLIGNNQGNTLYFNNTANLGATAPAYGAGITNAFGITTVGVYASPAFADMDGDGDLDLFIGDTYGNIYYFDNTAALGAIAPAYAIAINNPFGTNSNYIGGLADSALADVDRDGDLDLFVGNYYGNTIYFENTGTASSPAFAAAITNPFGITTVENLASPVLVDADSDGDLDLFIGNYFGNVYYFENTAAYGATTTGYAAALTNPFGITKDPNFFAKPDFADIDGDGDLDLYIGNRAGNIRYFNNTAAAPVAPVATTTANGSYSTGDLITLSVQFSEAVLVTGTPRLQLETGSTDHYATYSSGSGTHTLLFSYTVQAGDRSADLDVAGPSALDLNNGTIKDAAGNNAILTLAASGTTGSLAATAALVIDATAPLGLDLSTGSDSGVSSTDNITSDTTPTISGTAEAGSTVVLYDSDGTTSLGSTSADGFGAWSITASTLSAGSHSLTAKAIDGATNNTSSASIALNITMDGSAPHLDLSGSRNPTYAAGSIGFGLPDVGLQASPVLADINADGDLDLFISNYDGNLLFFENTGSATNPAFAGSATAVGLPDLGFRVIPALADLDGDGDLDLFIGERYGNILYFKNTGNSVTPAFAESALAFGLPDIGHHSSPTFADINGDGDLDLFIGDWYGNTLYLENTGTATNPAFAAPSLAFDLPNVGKAASPTFADINGDGDLDLFIGERYGNTIFFENIGTATIAAFAESAIAHGITRVNDWARPDFGDIDGDGDLDLVIGNYGGTTELLENTGSGGVTSTNANANYGIGTTITIEVPFSEVVYVAGSPCYT